MVLKTGELIEGLFKENMISVGRMIERDGTVYEGSWKDDLKDGDGVEIYPNGNGYNG